MRNHYSSFEDKQILVTGGSGAIGSNLIKAMLESEPEEIIVLDNLSSGYRWLLPDNENITFIHGDVRDEEKLKRVFKYDLDYVYHLAAHFANQNSVDHPETDLEVNGIGTLRILEYANMADLERFVYASSGCGVYGHDSELPFEEEDISISLDTPYQVTKLLGELYSNYFYNLYDLPITNARFFNSFGPGEVPGKYRNVIPNFFYWAMQGEPLPITGDGTETRDWTFVGDVVDGLLRLGIVDEAVGDSFNLATGNDTQVVEMAKSINERVDNDAGLEYKERRKWDNKNRIVGSIEKSQRVLGYEPSVNFQEGLDRVHDWFQNNYAQIDSCTEF